MLDNLLHLVGEHIGWSTIIGLVVSGTGLFAWRRRSVQKPKSKEPAYFGEPDLLQPPLARPAYSDRMAYVLAEMSALAYYQFEERSDFIDEEAGKLLAARPDTKDDVRKFLETFTEQVFAGATLSVDFLKRILAGSGFELLATIQVSETQGIACKRIDPAEPPYIVIAFRGTEQKVADWLTDADAVPKQIGDKKVHSGFYQAFFGNQDPQGKNVRDLVAEILQSDQAKDANGQAVPVYITGHSLGGALALLATCEFDRDFLGACYSFGAPRVANYEYFEGIKTPVYRVVNSSDIVPRIPPGAGMKILIALVELLSWATALLPKVSSLFDQLKSWLDKLNGYRHFGDLRYLTDVETGRFENVRLLPNPPAIDRAWWAWQHLGASLFFPISSHQMRIYREKLRVIANRHNKRGK